MASTLSESEVIKVYEPIAVINSNEGKKLLKHEDYDVMKKNAAYLIALKKSETGEFYGIVRGNEGKVEVHSDSDIDMAKKKYKLQ